MENLDFFCKKWAKMTDDNFHTEVRLDIAMFFGLTAFVNYWTTAKNLADKQGYIKATQLEKRSLQTVKMITQIHKSYGEEIANKVLNTL